WRRDSLPIFLKLNRSGLAVLPLSNKYVPNKESEDEKLWSIRVLTKSSCAITFSTKLNFPGSPLSDRTPFRNGDSARYRLTAKSTPFASVFGPTGSCLVVQFGCGTEQSSPLRAACDGTSSTVVTP